MIILLPNWQLPDFAKLQLLRRTITKKKRRLSTGGFVAVQVGVVVVFTGSQCAVSSQTRDNVRRRLTGRAVYPVVQIEDDQPLRVDPLAIALEMLHPPCEQICKAAKWIMQDTLRQSDETLRDRYTFYSHVGNALALWRKTRPADFWRRWRETHPYQAE